MLKFLDVFGATSDCGSRRITTFGMVLRIFGAALIGLLFVLTVMALR